MRSISIHVRYQAEYCRGDCKRGARLSTSSQSKYLLGTWKLPPTPPLPMPDLHSFTRLTMAMTSACNRPAVTGSGGQGGTPRRSVPEGRGEAGGPGAVTVGSVKCVFEGCLRLVRRVSRGSWSVRTLPHEGRALPYCPTLTR